MGPTTTVPSHAHPPPLFSVPRIATLLTSLLVALGSGTGYVYSAYSPQLGSRLHLTHTQQNIVGLSGNVGVYGTAPIWGRIADSRGPRILLVVAFFSLLTGYSGIRRFYDAGVPDETAHLSFFSFCLLASCSFLTGIGGNGGLASAMNATARSFPDSARGSTTALVISGFGLSAFLFSTVAHVVFPGDTSSFLLVLAIGTSMPMIPGFFFVRPIPLPHSESMHTLENGVREEDDFDPATPSVIRREDDSHTYLLASQDEDDSSDQEEPLSAMRYTTSEGAAVALGATTATHNRRGSRGSRRSLSPSSRRAMDVLPNVTGFKLARSSRFWLIFTITALLAGTGLMYINNVGSISQALFAKGNDDYDDVKASQWQATQVSTVSIMNCLGRFLIGIIADVTKNQLHLPRSFCISLVAFLFICSQFTLYSIEDVSSLWRASAMLGLAYGGMFGLFPTITIDWFGLPHFSENWGWVSLSPIIGSNVFSIAFGRNLDAHAPAETEGTAPAAIGVSRASIAASHQCLTGRECYVDSVKLTIAACCVALVLAVFAGWRDYRKTKKLAGRERVPGHAHAAPVVVWEGLDE